MIDLKARIIGSETVAARFAYLAPKLRKTVFMELQRLTIYLQRYVKQEKLNGRPGLKVQTGTLRRSITYRMKDDGARMEGTVGTVVRYGAAHEFGFDGVVTVKAHMRTIKQAWGRSITPVSAQVKAHPAHRRLPERSFLRSSLRENMTYFSKQMQEVVQRVLAGGK